MLGRCDGSRSKGRAAPLFDEAVRLCCFVDCQARDFLLLDHNHLSFKTRKSVLLCTLSSSKQLHLSSETHIRPCFAAMSAELDLAGQDVQVKQSSNSPTIVPPSSNTLSERGTAKLLQVYRAAPAFQEQSTSTNEASQALFTKLYALQNTPLHTLAYKIRASGVNRQDLARYLAKLDKMSADSLPAELQQLQRDWREVKLQPAEDPLV